VTVPDSLLDEIRARLSLVETVGRHVRLIRRGREFLGLCPFHGEKTPSFTVNEQKGFYHCFGCGAHGSLFDFVMAVDHLTFPQAVERLAEQAGVALPRPQPADAERERQRQSLFAVVEHAARWFEDALKGTEGAAARAYLAARGLDAAAIARFRLGYAPPGRMALRTALTRAGFDVARMVEAGLLIRPEDRSGEGAESAYDRFRGRVMFPISDRRGRIVGFGGRILGAGEPKYLNSPETPLFHKGRLLYGVPAAVEAARKSGRLIVVEGYMDQIGLSLAGYPETVAPLGTALTEDQLQELWRLAAAPILCFDPDTAGRRAAMRACERALPLLRPGLGLRFAFLGTGTDDDPDAVARRYPAQFLARAFAEAVPLSTMLVWLETGGRLPATPEDRAAVAERLRQRATTITDATVRQQFQGSFREALRPPARAWGPQRGGNASRRRDRRSAPAIFGDVPAARLADIGDRLAVVDGERTLLAILCIHPWLFHEVEDEIGHLHFGEAGHDHLRQGLIVALSGHDIRTAEMARQALAEEALQDVFDRITADPFVRRHRLIAADAAVADVRATWRANVNLLRRMQAAEAGRGSASETEPPSEASLARRFAARRAALANDADPVDADPVDADPAEDLDESSETAPPARRVP
jgi:DNA primase